MDKKFFIAILLSFLIIIIYSSPQYQKRFGKEIPRKPGIEKTRTDSIRTTDAVRPAVVEPSQKRDILPAWKDTEKDSVQKESEETKVIQVNRPESEEVFFLENEDVRITFSPRGGEIKSVVLKKYDGKIPEEPVQIVAEGGSWYNGHIQEGDSIFSFTDIVFSSQVTSRQHAVLRAEISGNKTITKEFTLESDGFILKAKTGVSGNWDNPTLHFTWHGPINITELPFRKLKIWPFSMFMRDDTLAYQKIVYLGDGNRTTIINGDEKTKKGGKRIFPKEDHAQKLDARKTGQGEDIFTGELDWYAVRNKYFMSIAVPHEKMRWNAFSRFSNTGEDKWFDFTLTKKISDGNTDMDIYLGPISYDILKGYGRNLTEAMELSFRFIRPLSIVFLWSIKKIHTFIPNWGLVIIVFSLIIKILLFPLSHKSFVSMRKMSSLQPQINELRDKYKKNPQNLHKATMELYKKEGVNPFSGCLPTLLQMPVFIALYPVVGRAFELRQAMFIPHWIEDLSRPDPFYILPIAMGISMFFQSKATMKDPNQKAMLYIMPVMMVVLFANFSSGLTLYWFLFNIISFLQQKIHRP